MDFAEAELGPKMQACSERERRFVWALLTQTEKPNPTQAARDAGYSDSSEAAKVRAHYLMHRERVLEAMEEVGRRAFRGLLLPTIAATRALIEKPDHPDHSRTLQSTLSRLGLSERTSVDVNVGGSVTVNHTDAAVNDLRIMKAMGASQHALEQAFGFSGLPRLEAMLEEAERRAGAGMKLIEGEVVNGG